MSLTLKCLAERNGDSGRCQAPTLLIFALFYLSSVQVPSLSSLQVFSPVLPYRLFTWLD